MRKLCVWITPRILLILITLSITLEQPRPSLAASPPILDFQQFDLDGDGFPDKAVIECSCVTNSDKILIFDGAGDMQPSANWKIGTDIANDIWVFDIGSDDRANLIITFRSSNSEQIAHLYDDTNGDGAVTYHVEGKRVVIDESSFWSLEVTAQPGWFMENGYPNLNIKALLDKPFPHGFEFIDESFAQTYMPHDGAPDVAFDMVDRDHNGAAEYAVARLLSDFPKRFGVGKSSLWFNAGDKRSQQPASAWFWPFLDLQPPTGNNARSLRYFDRLPRVSMDWQLSQIRGFVLPGYPIGSGYHVNNLQPIELGQVNDADFEAPHAYYDLAANRDAYPELNIRLFRLSSLPWQEIRYSWNQFNLGTLMWDYKLGLMDDHPIDGIVDLSDFSLRMVPYEHLPYWVTEREWKLTTFVAREDGQRESSEGIYAWTPWAGADPVSSDNPSAEAHEAATSYLAGTSEHPPYKYFTDIWVGYRGEYNLARPSKPILYFGSIDHRLHLKGAEHGLLNLGNERYVTYENQDGDAYLDQWRLWEAGELCHQLYFVQSHLLYAGENQVLLKKIDEAPSLWEVLPPRSHQEWLALGEQLEAHRRDFASGDFEAMITQFEGPETRIEGATLRDFRPDGEGFRFVLQLRPDFQVSGSGGPDLTGLPPGAYVVTHHRDFDVRPLIPARLEILFGTFRLSQSVPVVLEPLWVEAVFHNTGLEDMPSLWVQTYAEGTGSPSQLVAETEVRLLADQVTPVRLLWTPSIPGAWRLSLVWSDDKDTLPTASLGTTALSVNVDAPQAIGIETIWRLSNVGQPAVLASLLASLGLAAAVLVVLYMRIAGGRP